MKVICQSFGEGLVGEDDGSDVAVEIVVSDTGCGMSTETLERIFRDMEGLGEAGLVAQGSTRQEREGGIGMCRGPYQSPEYR